MKLRYTLTLSTLVFLFISGCDGQTRQATSNLEAEGGDNNTDVILETDCASSAVLCVDDTSGATQEFSTIQSAVKLANPGDLILVYDGVYDGFQIGLDDELSNINGTRSQRITLKAQGSNAKINSSYKHSGSDIEKIAKRACGIVFLFGGDYWTVDGFQIVLPTEAEVTASGSDPQTPLSVSQVGEQGYHGAAVCSDGYVPDSNPLTGVHIKNNTLVNGGDSNLILGHCTECIIENNIVRNAYRIGSQGGHGVYLANANSDDGIIRDNVIYENDGQGIHMNGDQQSVGDGLMTNILIERNLIYRNGLRYGDSNGGVGVNMDGVQDSIIRNNLIYENAYHGIKAYGVDGAEGPKNIQIVNNTIITSSGNVYPIAIQDTSFRNNLGGHVIFNNILLGSSGRSILLNSSNMNFTSNNNIVGGMFYLDGTKLTFTEWMASVNQDSNSTTALAEDLFVDYGNGVFALNPDSPAANNGASSLNGVSAPTLDFNYANYGTPDIGSFAY